MRIRTIFAAAIALQLASPAGAQETFNVSGLGTLSCGKLLVATKTPFGRAQVSDWLNGFITGYNYYENRQLVTPPDKETSIAFVEAHCRNRPLSNIIVGAVELVQGLGGKRTTSLQTDP